MGIFDFFKKKNAQDAEIPLDTSIWTGKNFEFIIAGDIEVSNEDFDSIMTPKSLEWLKIERNGWIYFQVGENEFSYSFEPPGIQMTFNDAITFEKAKAIADEVVDNIKATGQKPELIIINKSRVTKF